MNRQTRIYKPGVRRGADDTQPEAQTPHSGQSSNGAGHTGAAESDSGETVEKPFPLHCLPPEFEAMARAIAEAERTPESLAGCCTLGFLSASVGAGLQVKSGANRVTRANLYLLLSAISGSGKSEDFRHAARPYYDFERVLLDAWKTSTLPGLQAEMEILESEIAKLKRLAGSADGAIERDEIKTQLERKKADLATVQASMHPPVLSVEDITTEKLAVMLATRGECIASMSADAGAIVNNLLGRYSKLDRTDEAIYLKAFSGDYCRVDRQGRDSVVLRSPCLAALWLVQPDKVETLLTEQSLTDGGLIPRLLICHTNAQPRPIIEGATGIPAEVSRAYAQSIRDLLEAYRLASDPRTIQPSLEALQTMNAHYNGIAARRLGELRDVTSFAARWNEQAWRISVCIHAGLHGRQAHEWQLELATAQAAIELADWFAAQQLEILSAGRMERRLKRVREVQSLLVDYGGKQTLRELDRRHGITHTEARQLAADFPDLLIHEKKNTGGRPSETLSLRKYVERQKKRDKVW